MPNSSPSTCAPSLMSATAEPPVVCPQWPPRSVPEKELARLSSRFGGCPPRSLMAAANSTSAVRMASVNFATSPSTSPTRASPTTSSTRL
eukprot:6199015-Pleurochrysis_carterae.AAC.1